MLLIVNPHASTVSDSAARAGAARLESRFEVQAVDTEARGHATELSREAAHGGYDLVVALGGDGTVNEAANGLLGSSTPLSCLPGGSANVFGKLLGIPGDLLDATEHLLALADDWQPRGRPGRRQRPLLHLQLRSRPRCDGRRAGRLQPPPEGALGPYYYSWVASRPSCAATSPRPRGWTVQAGERTLDGVIAIVQNGATFTYFQDRPIDIAEGAELDSGALAGGVMHRAGVLVDAVDRLAGVLAAAASAATARSPPCRMQELTVRTRRRPPAAAAGRRGLPRRGAPKRATRSCRTR